ncbi:MAG: glycosyltransferase [Acidobacteria bacterium]|jgi:glycosyltransferase involved in cell wall biosynthesis|nr:glycosyltransferase [Acidobacteriota bacterium]
MQRKVAIIHDWLNGMRGGEKVLEVLLEIFPDADIFTLFLEKENISDIINSHPIFPSSLNKYGLIRKHYKYFLPLFPSTIEEFDLRDYDVVISSSHCVAKGIIPHPNALHIGYIHSPMRYVWDRYYSYFGKTKGLKKFYLKQQISRLRTWDAASSARVDYFAANSRFIQQRIWRYYHREATVIHPPVDTENFQPGRNPSKDYFLTVSALVPYKENELLIEAFNQSGDRLIIVGKGPEEKKLKRMAAKNIEFKKDVSHEDLVKLFQNTAAFVYAGVEDFGIVFVEAQACGIPVVAYKKGGVLDIVNEESGILFDQQTTAALLDAIDKIKKTDFNPSFIRENSLKFSRQHFKQNFVTYFEEINEKVKRQKAY